MNEHKHTWVTASGERRYTCTWCAMDAVDALAEEREACAKAVEALYPTSETYWTFELGHIRADAAALIRARA